MSLAVTIAVDGPDDTSIVKTNSKVSVAISSSAGTPTKIAVIGRSAVVVARTATQTATVSAPTLPSAPTVVAKPKLNVSVPVVSIPGPPGKDGVLPFLWDQTSASAAWMIPHNLGRYPSVVVRDSTGRRLNAAIQDIDKNNLLIQFSVPVAGEAELI